MQIDTEINTDTYICIGKYECMYIHIYGYVYL